MQQASGPLNASTESFEEPGPWNIFVGNPSIIVLLWTLLFFLRTVGTYFAGVHFHADVTLEELQNKIRLRLNLYGIILREKLCSKHYAMKTYGGRVLGQRFARTGCPKCRGSSPGRVKNLLLFRPAPGPSLLSNGYRRLSPRG
jgi:hypothetical protein